MSRIGKSDRRTQLTLVRVVLGLAAASFLAAMPVPAARTITVGDFAVLVASRLQIPDASQPALTQEAAVMVLQRSGIKIRPELSSTMTEADAADIFGQLGISLAAQDPASPLLRDRALSLLGIFGSTLSAKVGTVSPAFSRTGGADLSSSAPAPMLEQSIIECQNLPKTQDCQTCCRDLLGGAQSDSHTNRICGKACNTKSRNVSASEPTP
ncbi:MAG TPA: hypothetical protein VGR67_01705 [Candidatus Polarisedimenticolia bacterium]|jgi:hypothetical protein|nr:hypothetical protein [Candidatus Polarisedimenticolia bacterium]